MSTEKLWSNISNWILVRPNTSSFLLFLLLSITVTMISIQRFQILKEERDREMNLILKNIHQNIEQSLKNCYTTTVSLAFSINDNGIPKDFDSIGKKLLQSNPIISLVQLSPNGVIKYIYPLKGNEAVINLDILGSKYLKEEAYKTIKTQKICFAGPIKLAQGGIGIIGRLPMYNGNKFWGFSSVVVKLDSLLKYSGINSIDKSKYDFQFSKRNPVSNKEKFFLPSKTDLSKYYKYYSIPDSNWKLYLITKEPIGIPNDMLIPIFIGLILAIAIGFMFCKILKTPQELKFLLKEQEEKLLRNEIKFKTIFEQATIGFAIIDASTNEIKEANNKYCEMLGYSFDEIIEKGMANLTHPDDVENSLLNLKKLNEDEINEYSSEKRYITSSGKTVWVNLTVSRLWESDEKKSTYIAFIKDITTKKEADLAIQQSEKRFKSIFDNSPLPLWEEDFSAVKNRLVELDLINKNPKNVLSYFNEHPDEVFNCISLVKIIDVNIECLKLHKTKDKDTLLENLDQLIGLESLEAIKSQLVAISQNEQNFSIDSRVKDMEGQYHDIHLKWSVKAGYEDCYGMVILSTQDITDRKATEKMILNSHQRTESIIDNIDGIVWEYDLETMSSTFISKKIENILGYTVEEYMASSTFWEDHIHPEDREFALGLSTIVNKKYINHDYEYRMITKKGKIIWIRDIVNFIFEKDKPIISRGIMIDITVMKEAEKDLSNSFHLVSEQNKRLLNFSYIVSHNLRSHTSNIESIISLIESAETEEERIEMMKLLKSVSNSLDNTMHHLNEVVNINTNISLVIKPLKLNLYINKAIEVLTEQVQLNEASFIINVPDDATVNYNSAYLESILYNLISNAIRYKHPQRKPIITIKLYKKRDEDVLEISDNGFGINLEKHGDKIFGMYKTFSNNPDARGIGLFITKNQIDAMEGTIKVESIPNIGTTFKIYTK